MTDIENKDVEAIGEEVAKTKTAKKAPVKKKLKVKAVETVETTQAEVVNATPAPDPVVEEVMNQVQVVEKKKIMFVASEAAPFIATGGLAEVIGSLSKTRHIFLFGTHTVEVDVYPLWKRSCVLEVELESETEELTLPSSIEN